MNSKLITKDIYCVVGCLFLYIFSPFKITGLLFSMLSCYLVVDDFKRDKFKMLFINLGLFNAEKKTPILLKKTKNDLGERYIFSIPESLCLNDFEKYKSRIETAFKKPIKLELTNDYNLVMQIFDVRYKSVYTPNYGLQKGE